MYILAYLQNALKIRLEHNVPMKKAERRSLLRCPLRHGSFPFHCLFTGRAYHFGSGLCFYNAALFHTIDKPTAPLNQSSGTSRRLLFRLFLPRDLEIYKAFLRFWSRGRQKVCPPISPALPDIGGHLSSTSLYTAYAAFCSFSCISHVHLYAPMGRAQIKRKNGKEFCKKTFLFFAKSCKLTKVCLNGKYFINLLD